MALSPLLELSNGTAPLARDAGSQPPFSSGKGQGFEHVRQDLTGDQDTLDASSNNALAGSQISLSDSEGLVQKEEAEAGLLAHFADPKDAATFASEGSTETIPGSGEDAGTMDLASALAMQASGKVGEAGEAALTASGGATSWNVDVGQALSNGFSRTLLLEGSGLGPASPSTLAEQGLFARGDGKPSPTPVIEDIVSQSSRPSLVAFSPSAAADQQPTRALGLDANPKEGALTWVQMLSGVSPSEVSSSRVGVPPLDGQQDASAVISNIVQQGRKAIDGPGVDQNGKAGLPGPLGGTSPEGFELADNGRKDLRASVTQANAGLASGLGTRREGLPPRHPGGEPSPESSLGASHLRRIPVKKGAVNASRLHQEAGSPPPHRLGIEAEGDTSRSGPQGEISFKGGGEVPSRPVFRTPLVNVGTHFDIERSVEKEVASRDPAGPRGGAIVHSNGLSGLQRGDGSPNPIRTDGEVLWAQAMRQVNEGLTQTLQMRRNRAVLQLHPPELGKVRVELVVGRNNEIRASFLADHPEVKQIIEGNVAALRHQLSQSGFSLGECNVDVSDQRQLSFGGQGWQERMPGSGERGLSSAGGRAVETGCQLGEGVTPLENAGLGRVHVVI